MHILLALGVAVSWYPGLVQDKAAPPASPPAAQAPAPQEKAPPPPQTEQPLFKTLVKQFTLGGQVRFRGEYRDPTSYLNTAPAGRTDDFILSRIRLNMKFSVTDDIDV